MMNNGLEQMGIDLNETLGALKPQKKIERTVTVKEARELLIQEESSKLVNDADIHSAALRLAESSGSSSLMKSIRSHQNRNNQAKFLVKVCNGIFYRS